MNQPIIIPLAHAFVVIDSRKYLVDIVGGIKTVLFPFQSVEMETRVRVIQQKRKWNWRWGR